MKVNKITSNHSSFPKKLKNIHSVPKELYIKGDISPLSERKVVSIVGSRAVTPYGKQVTYKLAYELASKGIAIVSGLALGADSIAHRGALDAGGYTAAVLPSSVEKPYPVTNRNIAQKIVESGGALLSEYTGEMQSFRSNFIVRSRLVSGLADALLITEASEKSGSMHTANFALDQGKAVMAVPGNITSPNSKGTNNLIKAGATPITSTQDVLDALGLTTEALQQYEIIAENAEEQIILDILKTGLTDAAVILKQSKLDPSGFNQTLTMLEITGKIKPLGAGHWGLR